MSKEDMIKVIYEKIADKTLTRGCKFLFTNSVWGKTKLEGIMIDGGFYHCTNNEECTHKLEYEQENYNLKIRKIIGHPVMIGDVLDWIKVDIGYNYKPTTEGIYETNSDGIIVLIIFDLWSSKILPIDDQSEECISFIYNLCKDEPN